MKPDEPRPTVAWLIGRGQNLRGARIEPRHGLRGWAWAGSRGLTLVYASLVLIATVLVRFRGDEWWPATALMFLPRWVGLLPLPVLAWWSYRRKRRWPWGVQALTALMILGPLMGFVVPKQLGQEPVPGFRVRVLTWNVGRGKVDALGLARLIEAEKIDLVCLQEVQPDTDPALVAVFANGWHRDRRGTVASRWPIVEEGDHVDHWDGDYAFLRARVALVRVEPPGVRPFHLASVHLPTSRHALARLAKGDLGGYRAHQAWRIAQRDALLAAFGPARFEALLVAGDFNTPTESRMLDPLHERFAFAFEAAGWGYGATRAWARIDHILGDASWRFDACRVGPDLGSDHRPVIAEATLIARPPAPKTSDTAVAPDPKRG